MEQLAIFGGTPVREKPIYYGRQYIDDEDIAAVVETLKSDLITCGPRVEALEKQLCEATSAKYAVVVSNGTAALHLAALAAGFKEGDEVIVSSITFAASSNCVLYCGAKPVFADIRPDTYNIDPASVRKLITPKTKGIVAVDFTGQAVELDELREICKEFNLILIEDAAHAIGTKYKGQPVGSIADMTCFSFHPVKTVTGGEGGAITTNDESLYHRLLRLRTHGITRNQSEMVHPTDALWYNEQVELGYNYRMTDFQAALLSSQLRKLPKFAARRKEIVEMYDKAFAEMPEIMVQREIPESDTTRHLYIIRLNLEKLRCDRRQFF
ncbi:MAG: DegT/DnrJ/EryC1/StrS family aminotransferase, partial [Acetatifactor sp.]